MNRLVAILAVMVLVALSQTALAQNQGGASSPDNKRRSMGNLRPSTPPGKQGSANRKSRLHRPWSYGNAPYYGRPWSYGNPPYYGRPWSYGNLPYYRRPPVQYYPYYFAPHPYWRRPFYRYPVPPWYRPW